VDKAEVRNKMENEIISSVDEVVEGRGRDIRERSIKNNLTILCCFTMFVWYNWMENEGEGLTLIMRERERERERERAREIERGDGDRCLKI
jgi:hypothetical protein